MQWRRHKGGHLTARWQGVEFALKAGRLTANGVRVREEWPSNRKAMEAIENRQQQLILAAMRTVKLQACSAAHLPSLGLGSLHSGPFRRPVLQGGIHAHSQA